MYQLPYLGFAEAEIVFPLGFHQNSWCEDSGYFPVLVVEDTPYNSRVPKLLIGTNILKCQQNALREQYGDRFLQKVVSVLANGL